MIIDQSKDVCQVTARASALTIRMVMAFLKKVAETIERNRTEVSKKEIIKKAKDMRAGVEEIDLGEDKNKIIAIRNQLAKDGILFNIENDGHGAYTLTCLSQFTPHAAQVINKTIKDFEDKEKRLSKFEHFKAARIEARDKKIELMQKIKNKQKNMNRSSRENR